jgi:hypothetical protein
MKQIATGLVLISLFLTFSAFTSLKEGKITGKIIDKNNHEPVAFAAVIVRALPDSIVKFTSLTDTLGTFAFDAVPEGNYVISTQMVGYKPVTTEKIEIQAAKTHEVGEINLENFELKTIVVNGKRPFIEQKADRTVLNVEGSINSSGESAYEIVKKAPGVYVDKDEKISLRGKQGVMVMINDKPTHLSDADLANYLKGLQSSEIDKIEIITNPPARYDAAGNSGIINIKTKKNLKPGFNGSVNAGITVGKRTGGDGGLNLNLRKNKLNVFGNYNPGTYAGKNKTELDRTLTYNNITNRFTQTNEGDWRYNANSFGTGVDYDINSNNTIGVLVRGYNNNSKSDIDGNLFMLSNKATPDSSLKSKNGDKGRYKNMSYNINYKTKLDTLGKELNIDLDYGTFTNKSDSYNNSYYFDANGNKSRESSLLKGKSPSDITITSAKADYVQPLSKEFKLEAGTKVSFVETDNNLSYQVYKTSNWLDDPSRSNQFVYDENVLAGYFSLSYDKNNTSVKAGLRAEQTWSEGNSVTLKRDDKRNYLDWFPTFFVQQKINDNNSFGFTYNRRIDRPSYENLNPFCFYLDEYTYVEGNPYLKPQYTNSVSLNHVWKNAIITTLSYSRTDDVAVQYLTQNDSTKVTKQTNANLNNLNNLSLNISLNFNPTSWFRTNNNFTGFYNKYERKDLSGNMSKEQSSFCINSINTFMLPKSYSIELSGFYNSKMVYGLFEIEDQYSVDLGVQKTFVNNKATIKLSARDILGTLKSKAFVKYDNINLISRNSWDSQKVSLTFSYRFGQDDLKPSRQRSTGMDEQRNRIKS